MVWVLHPVREFARHAPAWDRLADACDAPPFLRANFIVPLLAEFACGKEKLAVCSETGELKAMTLVKPRSRGVWETFQPSQLPVGPWLMPRTENFVALTKSLLRSLPAPAFHLGLTQLDSGLIARPMDSGRIRTLDYIHTAWVPVEGPFDAYWQSRGKNLRANLRKQRRKLETVGISTRFETLTRREDVRTVIESYGRLESAGWKAALGTAIHPDNAQGRFYRTMLENFADAGAARMYRYWFDDRLVAVNLGIECRGTLVILKTTYDEAAKTLSPASLLCEEMFRTIFDEGRIHRVEFFGKLMSWHSQWTKESRPLFHVNCYRWAWMPRMRALLRRSNPTSEQPNPAIAAGNSASTLPAGETVETAD